jgi:hypothetical protein
MILNKFNKYGVLNTHDLFKFFAILFMFVDHVGYYIWQIQAFRLIGRLAFPILAVIYGYHFNYKVNKNLLFWGAPLILVSYLTKHNILPLNILFSFFIGGKLIQFYEKIKYKLKKWDINFIFPLLILFNFYLYNLFEYGSFIIFFMICGMLFKENTNNNRYVISLVIFWLYLLDQFYRFGFNCLYMLILAILLFCVFTQLKNYELKPCEKPLSPFIENTIMFIGRYSMEFYAAQLALFKIANYFIKK